MAFPFLEPQSEVDQTDRHPLLMERPASSNAHEHVIIITRGDVASTSVSRDGDHNDSGELHYENGPSRSSQAPTSRSSSSLPTVSNSRNVSLIRRGDHHGRRHRSPLNSGLWISIEFIVNVSQIIAAVIVLSLSRYEHPQAPLFAWIMGYTAGCIASLLLYLIFIGATFIVTIKALSKKRNIHIRVLLQITFLGQLHTLPFLLIKPWKEKTAVVLEQSCDLHKT